MIVQPNYLREKTKLIQKSYADLSSLLLAQELVCSSMNQTHNNIATSSTVSSSDVLKQGGMQQNANSQSEDAIWVIKFRQDGLYMATGGQEGVLRIWKASMGTPSSKLLRSGKDVYRPKTDI